MEEELKEAPEAPEKQETQEEEKPGTQFVDFSKLPPEVAGEVEERFKRIYGHMKQNERLVGQLVKDHKAVLQRLDDGARKEAEARLDSRLTELRKRKTAALQAAEYEKVAQIDEEIITLKTAKPEAKPEEKKEEPEPHRFTPEEEKKLLDWAGQRDADNNLLRPWANPKHEKHARAIEMATAVLHDPEFQEKGMEAVLAEVDRLMAVPKAVRTAPAVLSGDPMRVETKDAKLSEEQKLVARKLGFSEKQYAEAMKKWGTAA